MKTYKTIIVDDERLAREEVKRALAGYPDFVLVGEAANADAALVMIDELEPDLIFLDIRMPEKTGFDLLEELTAVPEVIFTTAYDQYALQAFEFNALDYLVKPVREERFAQAMKKVRRLFAQREEKKSSLSLHHKIFIKDGEKCFFIPLSDIRLIESADNYAVLHFGETSAMIKRSLNTLSERLQSDVFFRINRAQIVNTQYIARIDPHFNNKLQIVLTSGETLEVSGRQSAKFRELNSL